MALTVACVTVGACGKKGAPLAPFVHVPAAVDKLTAQRVGNEVYLTVTIPAQNIDASTPADVSRVDIFAATSSTPPPRPRIFEIATKVASIEVQPAVRPGSDAATSGAAAESSRLPLQGATVSLRETLTAADLLPKELPAAVTRNPVTPAASPAPPSSFPHRYYIAVATSDRGRSGPPGALLDLPMPPLPDPPGAVTTSYDEEAVTVSWEPSGGMVGFLLANGAAPEPAPTDELSDAVAPPAPTAPMYNVYRDRAREGSVPASAVGISAPVPLNGSPLSQLTYRDATPIEFGRERCYAVRAVRGTAPNLAVSLPSEPHCLTLKDSFAPAAPTALNAISADGVISLIWEPNGEADLDGYLVLRGRAGDATLQRLTGTPVKDVRYEDRDVMPGTRYVYSVQAIDTNQLVSAESNRVEETAR